MSIGRNEASVEASVEFYIQNDFSGDVGEHYYGIREDNFILSTACSAMTRQNLCTTA